MTLALDVIEWASTSPRGSYPRDLWREILRLRQLTIWRPMTEVIPTSLDVVLVRQWGKAFSESAALVRERRFEYGGWAYPPEDPPLHPGQFPPVYAVAGVEADGGYPALARNQETQP